MMSGTPQADQMFTETMKKMKALAEATSQEFMQAKVSLAVDQAIIDMKKAKVKEMEKALAAAKTTKTTEQKKSDSTLKEKSNNPMKYATKPASKEGIKRKAANGGGENFEQAPWA